MFFPNKSIYLYCGRQITLLFWSPPYNPSSDRQITLVFWRPPDNPSSGRQITLLIWRPRDISSSGRQITLLFWRPPYNSSLLAAARLRQINYIKLYFICVTYGLPYFSFRFVSLRFFSFLFFFFCFVSFLTILFSFFCVSFFFVSFRCFSPCFLFVFFSFRFFSFLFVFFRFSVYRYPWTVDIFPYLKNIYNARLQLSMGENLMKRSKLIHKRLILLSPNSLCLYLHMHGISKYRISSIQLGNLAVKRSLINIPSCLGLFIRIIVYDIFYPFHMEFGITLYIPFLGKIETFTDFFLLLEP